MKVSEVCKFLVLCYIPNQKLENLENLSFISIKKTKNELRQNLKGSAMI